MRKYGWRVFVLGVVAFSALLWACQGGEKRSKTESKDVEFTDYYGRELSVGVLPQRVVSLSPGITELLFDLGQGDRLVGRTKYCLYPPKAQEIPSLGGISDANLELIISTQPDIVFTASMVSRSMVEKLESLGITVVCLPERKRVEQVYETVSLLGEIFECKHLADSLIGDMKGKIEKIIAANKQTQKPTVYYVAGFGESGDFTCGGDTFISDIISLAGGENIAKEVKGWSIGKEEIFAREPQFIIVRREDAQRFKTTAPYNRLKAVKEGRVLGMESAIMDCQTLRTPQAIEQISRFLHSELR